MGAQTFKGVVEWDGTDFDTQKPIVENYATTNTQFQDLLNDLLDYTEGAQISSLEIKRVGSD